MKKLNTFLNATIGFIVGFFAGDAGYTYYKYRTHPELYEIHFYSATGEVVLIIAEDDLVSRQSVGDAYAVEVNVGGKTKAYVLGYNVENEEDNK